MCELRLNLIMCVEKYPCLWDFNNNDYHNRDVKDLAWEQICKQLFENWETCTDKSNKCADLKKKWTNIRDYYRKEIQKTKNVTTGSAAKKSKKYIYGDLLYFLTPIFAKNDTGGNYAKENIRPEQTENDVEQSYEQKNIEPPSPAPVINKKKNAKDVPTQILNILHERQKTNMSSNIPEDDDTKFLLSFRSYMKNMNTRQKIDFQLGMLQLVKNVCMGNSTSSSQFLPELVNNNSSVSIPSPHSVNSSYSPVPQTSPIYYNINSPPTSTFVPSQQSKYVLERSPTVYLNPSQSGTSYSSSQHVNTITNKPRILIHSISKLTPHQQNPVLENPVQAYLQENPVQEYILPTDNNILSDEDNEAAQFLVQSQNKEEKQYF